MECGFTLKCVCDMKRTYSQKIVILKKVGKFRAQCLLMPQGFIVHRLKIKKNHECIKIKLSYCSLDNLEFDFYHILFPFLCCRGLGRLSKSPIFLRVCFYIA